MSTLLPKASEAIAPLLPADSIESTAEPRRSLLGFWRPRYWPAWALVAWLRIWAALPLEWSLAVHRLYGRAMSSLARRQRHIAKCNLELCFPSLTPAERESLLKCHFESMGMSIAEVAFAWFAPDRRNRGRFTVRGLEHVTNALAQGRGAILCTGHFTTLEICGRPLKLALPRFTVMFSRRSNALLDEVQKRGRLRLAHEAIPSDNVRALLRALKRNAAVWYAPDQMHSLGALVPFFGEPAMTSLATSKLARLSGAPVVPFSYRRTDARGHYELEFHAPLRELPTADALADTRALVRRLEEFIRAAPEQYQWLHRRFKDRPAPLLDPYRTSGARERPVPAREQLAERERDDDEEQRKPIVDARPLERARVGGFREREAEQRDDGEAAQRDADVAPFGRERPPRVAKEAPRERHQEPDGVRRQRSHAERHGDRDDGQIDGRRRRCDEREDSDVASESL